MDAASGFARLVRANPEDAATKLAVSLSHFERTQLAVQLLLTSLWKVNTLTSDDYYQYSILSFRFYHNTTEAHQKLHQDLRRAVYGGD